jgi:hypothetical protein
VSEPSFQLTVTDREGGASTTCAYCHDELGGTVAAFCPLCNTRLHADCVVALERCPTIGCKADFSNAGDLRRKVVRVDNRLESAYLQPAARVLKTSAAASRPQLRA